MTKDVPAPFEDWCSTSTGALKFKLWVFSVACTCLLLLPVADAQTGFISIDCGSTRNYTDEKGIKWSTDDGYTTMGTNMNVTVPQSQVDNRQQLSTARYFQSGGKRYCYIFPVTNNASYLIRASFLYGDLASPLPTGYSFDLAIDSSKIWHVAVEAGYMDNLVTVEFFVASRSTDIAFCLLPSKGSPFISSLELRPLEPKMYFGYMFFSQIGVLARRLNCGASLGDPAIRFPDDMFDRVWETPGSSYAISTVNTSAKLELGGIAIDNPPLAVMQSAWQERSFSFWTPFPQNERYYVALYFAEFKKRNATETRRMNLYLNEQSYKNFTIDRDGTAGEVYAFATSSTWAVMNVTLEAEPSSVLPAFLNAFEVHRIYAANTTTTSSFDREILSDLQHSLNLTAWIGDPCLPVPWVWLSCTSDNPAMVTQIKLSDYQLHGTIPPNIGSLAALTDLWLDNNFITGPIPNLGGLTQLRTLHLQNNSLNGTIPPSLAEIPLLTELFLQDNDFNGRAPAALVNKTGLTLRVDDSNSLSAPPESSTPASSSGSKKKSASIAPIIGAIAGGAVVVLLLVGALLYCLRKRRKIATIHKHPNETSDQPGSVRSMKPFSLAEVNKITNGFETKIGEGGFGPVYFGKLDNGREVAVKVNSETSGQGRTEFYTEVSLLSRIHHRNLVHLIGFCDESNKRILIYEFMKGGMLRDHLYGKGQRDALDWPTRLRIAIDAARGLEYLHYDCHPRIIHRDVKSNNILLDENLQAKMIDFGISKSHEQDTTSEFSTVVKGTSGYLDPEYYSSSKLTYKSDVFAFGVVLLEIMSGRAPINNKFADQRRWVLVDYARQMLNEGRLEMVADRALGHNYDKESMWKVAELALRCVDARSVNRPDMREVLKDLVEATQYEHGMESGISSFMSTSEVESRDISQTFSQNSQSTESPSKSNHGFFNYPSYEKLSSSTAAPSSRGDARENTATAPWNPPGPR